MTDRCDLCLELPNGAGGDRCGGRQLLFVRTVHSHERPTKLVCDGCVELWKRGWLPWIAEMRTN